MKDPDGRLVIRAKSGEAQALDKLIRTHYEMVYAVSFGVLGSREEAQDVAQEVFAKLFYEIKRFEGKSKFKTWLYRITVNSAIDMARKHKQAVSLEDAGEMVSRERGPRDKASDAELKQVISEGLKAISEDHRAVLTLREWHGLSYEEIAEILNVEVGTVMSRLHYAKKTLAGAIEKKLDK